MGIFILDSAKTKILSRLTVIKNNLTHFKYEFNTVDVCEYTREKSTIM